jgi:hypothetical protein
MNRRNVLVLLAVVAISGGLIAGTGAFSQVEADRTVSISTAGDSAALLSLSVDTSYNGINDTSTTDGANSESTIQIDLEEINDDATTTFNDTLTIENNGNNSVDLSINDTSVDGVTFTLADDSVEADGQTTADIEVDTTGSVSDSGTVTINATDNS